MRYDAGQGLRKSTSILAGLLAVLTVAAVVWANDASPDALIENGHWKRLSAIAQQKLRANPNDARANYWMAFAKFEYRDYDGAEPYAEKAVKLDPNQADYHFILGAVSGRKAENTGNPFSKWSLARKVKREFDAAIALDPRHVLARVALVDFHLEAPGFVGGDKKKAYTLADELLQIDPARGWLAKARIARKEKQTAQLESFYLKAVEANRRHYGARLALSNFYDSDGQKKHDLAEKHAREAITIAPDRAGAYAQLSGLFAYQQRWKDLDAILARAEKNVPDNLSPFFHAGRVLISNHLDAARAERYLRKYLTQPPEPDAPSPAVAHLWLGRALEKLGRTADAVREFQEAARLDPKLEEAKKELKRLKK